MRKEAFRFDILLTICVIVVAVFACVSSVLSLTRSNSVNTLTSAAEISDFAGGWVDEERVSETIRSVWDKEHYLLDPHTAVGYAVWEEYCEKTGDRTPTLLVSTASPYKFARDVLRAVGREEASYDDFDCAFALEKLSGLPMPETLRELKTLPVLHTQVCEIGQMPSAVLSAVD